MVNSRSLNDKASRIPMARVEVLMHDQAPLILRLDVKYSYKEYMAPLIFLNCIKIWLTSVLE